MPKSEKCMPYLADKTVYMMCVMLEQRDKDKAEAKKKKKEEQ